MPELPEVETIRRGLEPVLAGRVIAHAEVRRPDLRWPFPPRLAKRLTGRRVAALRRRSKYLLADLDGGETLILHLGMSGRLLVSGRAARRLPPRAPGAREARPRRPRRRRAARASPSTTPAASAPWTSGRRPSSRRTASSPASGRNRSATASTAPTSPPASPAAGPRSRPCSATSGSSRASATSTSPRRSGGRASRPSASPATSPRPRPRRSPQAVRAVLRDAIAAGGSSLRDYRRADGELGYFQHSFAVYDREGEPCPRCGGAIVRSVQSGRSSFWCPACQT